MVGLVATLSNGVERETWVSQRVGHLRPEKNPGDVYATRA